MNRTLKRLLIQGGGRLTGGGALPFQDTFTRADGALGGSWLGGPTWAIVSGKAVNTPTAGPSELLTDSGMENWTSATDLTSWAETISGTSRWDRSADAHGGSYAAQLTVDASAGNAFISNYVPTIGVWYRGSVWAKRLSAAATVRFGFGGLLPTSAAAATYGQHLMTGRAATASGFILVRSVANDILLYDDASFMALSLPTLFAPIQSGSANVTVSAAATITAGTQAGVVCNLDSVASPANFVIGYHDGVSAKLDKCVNGTYTTLVTATTAYSAGATVQVVKSGTTYKLYYNGTQVGADQTVSDAGIIGNTYHGLFSTCSGNQLDSFTVSAT
jgi:hypothetical protein